MYKEYVPCHRCTRPAICDHEPIHGNGRKQLSMEWGLTIPVCAECHAMFHLQPETNEKYKIEMQERFEEQHGHEKYMEIFRTNYL